MAKKRATKKQAMKRRARKQEPGKKATTEDGGFPLTLVKWWKCPTCGFLLAQDARFRGQLDEQCPYDKAPLEYLGARREVYGFDWFARMRLAGLETLYHEQRDPYRAAEAYRWARAGRYELPAWVTRYIDQIMDRLHVHSLAIDKGRDPETTLAHVLGLDRRGGASPAEKRKALRRQQQYAVDLLEIMRKGYSEPEAIRELIDALTDAAQETDPAVVDAKTLERALRAHERANQHGGIPLPVPSEIARQIKPH